MVLEGQELQTSIVDENEVLKSNDGCLWNLYTCSAYLSHSTPTCPTSSLVLSVTITRTITRAITRAITRNYVKIALHIFELL